MSLFSKLQAIYYLIKLFYWISIKSTIKVLYRNRSFVGTQLFWSQMALEQFKVTMHKLPGSQATHREKCLVLANHRTQADFFLNQLQTESQCSFLSRCLVGIVFIFFFISGRDSIWFFNRGAKTNPDKFNEWLDGQFRQSSRPSLLGYPQGHRMGGVTHVDKNKLKSGLIRYAYRRQMPVQIVMSFGNEHVINEKKLIVNKGRHVFYKLSGVHYPGDYADQNAFVEAMKDKFVQQFDEVYQEYLKEKEALEHKA